jgi:hypothetical protein
MKVTKSPAKYVICIKNYDYKTSLETRKIYQTVYDEEAMKHNLIRVIDESGEDYLYPKELFMPIELPDSIQKVLSSIG